jgi:hypothetical protein
MLIPLWKWLTLGVATEFFPTSIWWWSGVTWRFPRGKSYFYHRIWRWGCGPRPSSDLGAISWKTKRWKGQQTDKPCSIDNASLGHKLLLLFYNKHQWGHTWTLSENPVTPVGHLPRLVPRIIFARTAIQVVPGQAGGGSFKFETPIAYRADERMCV